MGTQTSLERPYWGTKRVLRIYITQKRETGRNKRIFTHYEIPLRIHRTEIIVLSEVS